MNDLDIVKNIRQPTNLLFSDYLSLLFNSFQELSGDRSYINDESVIGGLAKLDNTPVIVFGQEKGRSIYEKSKHNYGMTRPGGYKKGLRLFELAEKFSLPIITFIDTPGAYPDFNAEKNGQAAAIAKNLYMMSALKTIIISIIIGEGCSGGALGIAVCDKLYMLDKSYLSPIKPEGCMSILAKINNLEQLTANMRITSNKLLKLKLIDGIIKSDVESMKLFINRIKYTITNDIVNLKNLSLNKLLNIRQKKLLSFDKR